MEDEEKPGTEPRSREEILKEAKASVCSAASALELLLGTDRLDTHSAADRFGEHFKELMADPNVDGWVRLCELLKDAKKDKRIGSSPGASEFLELMIDLAGDAITASTADEAIYPLAKAIKSSQNSAMARARWKKKREAKQWVISEWIKYKDEYKGNKAAFIRDYAKRIKNELGEKMEEKSIREYWLKGL
jgi:hypothetical protein